MIQDNEHWMAVTDSLYSAAIDGQGWYPALEGLARATGSESGQLIGLGADAAVPFNIITNLDPDWQETFATAGGGNPAINVRVGNGLPAPVLQVMAETDFTYPESHAHDPQCREFEDFMQRCDRPFICLAVVERQQDMLIGLAAVRSKRDGRITQQQRAAFTSLAPHVRAAVRMQLALEGQGTSLLVGAMEALSIPAFVCDGAGRVQALTPAAEKLAGMGRGLQLRKGHLYTTLAEDTRTLNDAIAAAACGYVAGGPPTFRTVVVHDGDAKSLSLVLDVIALPNRAYEFSFTPRVLVVARGERHADARKAAILQAAYALTAAETDVALQVARGRTADVIAQDRGVSIDTVRSQIKTILTKVGVHRQIELAAKLADL